MLLSSESCAVQRLFIRYATEAGWSYLSPEKALNLRRGATMTGKVRVPLNASIV